MGNSFEAFKFEVEVDDGVALLDRFGGGCMSKRSNNSNSGAGAGAAVEFGEVEKSKPSRAPSDLSLSRCLILL